MSAPWRKDRFYYNIEWAIGVVNWDKGYLRGEGWNDPRNLSILHINCKLGCTKLTPWNADVTQCKNCYKDVPKAFLMQILLHEELDNG